MAGLLSCCRPGRRRPDLWGHSAPWRPVAPVCGRGRSRGGIAVVLSPGAAPPRFVAAIRPVAVPLCRAIRPVPGRRPSVWGGTEQWPRSNKGGHRAGQSRPLTAVQCVSVSKCVQCASVSPAVTGAMKRGCAAAPCAAESAGSSAGHTGGDAIRPGGGDDAGGCGGRRPLHSGRKADDGAARAVSANDGATHGGARGNGASGDGASLGGAGGDGASLSGAGGDGASLRGAGGHSASLGGACGAGASLAGAGGDSASLGGVAGGGIQRSRRRRRRDPGARASMSSASASGGGGGRATGGSAGEGGERGGRRALLPPPLPVRGRTSLQAALSALRVELARVRARAKRAQAELADAERRVHAAKQVATDAGILLCDVRQSERAAHAAVLCEVRAFVREGRARPAPGL